VECEMYYLRLEKIEICRDGVPFPSKWKIKQLYNLQFAVYDLKTKNIEKIAN